jgi:TetR/AcrR family transcriptional regulator
VRAKRPGPAPAAGRGDAATDTRDLIFAAAATAFSTHGYDGVSVEAIAQAAGVNKAMIYYRFEDKLGLYRAVVRDMLEAVGSAATVIADSADAPEKKVERFIQTLSSVRETRPWFPPLMMREMAAGAPRLDSDTLALMKVVFAAFGAILQSGVAAKVFRPVHPLLAYMSIMGPMLMNAVRERAAARPGRAAFPMFVPVDRRELVAHMQETALRMLAKDRPR